MSGNVGEPQTHRPLSTVAPRKRSRQESTCDVDPVLGDSEARGGNSGASGESGQSGDGRQGGSQKRARSEGHGDPEVSRDSISWPHETEPRGASNQVHAPLSMSSASTRFPSGSTNTPRYVNSTEVLRQAEESFIPLPSVSSTSEVQQEAPGYGDSPAVGLNTVEDDIARSMAFDEQMEVLRHSPVSLPPSPVRREQSRSVELPVEAQAVLGPEFGTPSESTSPEIIGELEVLVPETRVQDEVHRTNPSGRLNSLADTPAMHSRILRSAVRRTTSTLPTIETALTTSREIPPSMPPSRLRILRRHEFREESRVQTTMSPLPSRSLDSDQSSVLSGGIHFRRDEVLRRPVVDDATPFSSLSTALSPLPESDLLRSAGPSGYPTPGQNYHARSSRASPHEIHGSFDAFELDDRPFPVSGEVEETPLSGPGIPDRRLWPQSVSHTFHGNTDRSLQHRIEVCPDSPDSPDAMLNVTRDDHLTSPGQEIANAPQHLRDGRAAPWRMHTGNNRSQRSFWTSIFSGIDSERERVSRRPTSLLDDNRGRVSDSEADLSFSHPRSPYDELHDDLRRRSFIWDSPRRASGQSQSDHNQRIMSSSSSSSSYGRPPSRSLLDPNLSFGSGSSTSNSHSSLLSTSVQEQEQAGRSSVRPSRLISWLGERNIREAEEPLDSNRSPTGSERRHGEGLRTLSSFFLPRGENHSSASGSPSHRINRPRGAHSDATRLTSAHLTPGDRAHESRPLLNSMYDAGHPTSMDQAHSPGQSDNDSSTPIPQDFHAGQSTRRRFSPGPAARHSLSASYDQHHSFSSLGFNEHSLPVSSRFRMRRPVSQSIVPPRSPEPPADSMEDIITESNIRDSGVLNASIGRESSSQLSFGRQPLTRIEPPPPPVEPRLSWDVGPCPIDRVPSRRLHSSLSLVPPMMRPDSPDAVYSPSSLPVRPQRPVHGSYHTLLRRPVAVVQPSTEARLTSSAESDERRMTHIAANTSRPDSRAERRLSNESSDQPFSASPRHEAEIPRVETFNELVRRRASRAETQIRANRQTSSPDATFRPAYRLPRPNFLHHGEDTGRRDRLARPDGRSDTFSTRVSNTGSSPILEDSRRERLARQHAAILLERSISNRYSFGDSPFNRQDWDSGQEERDSSATASVRLRVAERPTRPGLFSTSMDISIPETAQGNDEARERRELHDVLGRRARDNELSTRRFLSNVDRTGVITARDPMSIETTRNLQRRLRESEAEVDRALRALDQWGELEGTGDGDSNSTQSRMHRFGETLRRRRVPPAFSFSDRLIGPDSILDSGPSTSARPGHRSPSPTTAATRMQSRQARFARVQGRFREAATDMFGEPRSRGAYASRLEMLGGFPTRYAARNLGDYMRDEDFDASYENLVRLAASVGEAKPRGTPAHLLAAMPTGFYKDFATPGCDDRCPICLDDYKDLDPVLRITDCDHWFHKECLEQWLSGENSCPICRKRIRGSVQRESSENVPGPSNTQRDDGSDDDMPEGGSAGPGRVGSPGLTLEELNSYAAGW